MPDDRVHCFLPCRKGSERVPRKNVKPFAGAGKGLIEVKLRQLLEAARIETIVLSTDDEEIMAHAAALDSPRIRLHRRSAELASSATSTDALVRHARSLVADGHILWTHVTSPFVTGATYDAMIAAYFEALGQGHDSLMSCTPVHGFLWNRNGPLNYDRRVEKWPRTQTLEPVREVNSAAFLAPVSVYDTLDDRIGEAPALFDMDPITGMDIDWPTDFLIAEQIVRSGIAEI